MMGELTFLNPFHAQVLDMSHHARKRINVNFVTLFGWMVGLNISWMVLSLVGWLSGNGFSTGGRRNVICWRERRLILAAIGIGISWY